jgi:hypothetical protein
MTVLKLKQSFAEKSEMTSNANSVAKNEEQAKAKPRRDPEHHNDCAK